MLEQSWTLETKTLHQTNEANWQKVLCFSATRKAPKNHSVPHTYSETTTCLAPNLRLCINSRPNQGFQIKIGEDKDTILVDDLKLSRTIPQNRIGICRRSSFKFWAHPYLSKNLKKLCPPSNIAAWWYTYPSEIYQSVGVMKFPNWMESHERHVHHQPDSNGKSSNITLFSSLVRSRSNLHM